jgi:cellulose synthase/poly-beta-1,6-N-acetylglucosamine synthase-like glycosyltransferase
MLDIVELLATIPTAILLAILISQFAIIIARRPVRYKPGHTPSVTVLIPAHNEGPHIKTTVDAVLQSGYKGKLGIIVMNDGSTDDTGKILKSYSRNPRVRVLNTNHIGKSRALNRGLALSKSEIVITIDGDTRLDRGAIGRLVAPFSDPKVAATTGVIKVENTRKPLSWFQRLEYLNFAWFKSVCERISAVIAASGPLSAFRRKALVEAGGFSPHTYLEDFDVALKLIKNGYRTRFVDTAYCFTFVPEKLMELARQRLRWTRGGAQIIKMHWDMFLNRKYKGPGMYSLPLLSYWYLHSVLIGIALLLQIVLGYNTYFLSQGVVFSPDVALYLFNWFSVFGIITVAWNVLIGAWSLTLLSALNILLLSATYLIFLLALWKFQERFTLKDLLAFIFMFPYWLVLLFVHALSNLEWTKKEGKNWWQK